LVGWALLPPAALAGAPKPLPAAAAATARGRRQAAQGQGAAAAAAAGGAAAAALPPHHRRAPTGALAAAKGLEVPLAAPTRGCCAARESMADGRNE
jgi:hypothetical protein